MNVRVSQLASRESIHDECSFHASQGSTAAGSSQVQCIDQRIDHWIA
jgi:hypothetical protein